MTCPIDFNSAYEIVTHPGDLHISLCKVEGIDVYFLTIMRGPGRSFSPIVTLPPSEGTRQQAVRAARNILKEVRLAVVEEVERGLSRVSTHLDLPRHGLDLSTILTPRDISRIISRLRLMDAVPTYTFRRTSRWTQPLSYQVQ